MTSEWKVERKTSGWVVVLGVAITLVMAIWVVNVGIDWFDKGRLRLCLPSDSNAFIFHERPLPPDGNEDADPLSWCAEKTILTLKKEQAEQKQLEAQQEEQLHRLDEDSGERALERAKACPDRQVSFDDICATPQTVEEKKFQEDPANALLLSPTVNNYEPIRSHGFFGNTFIDHIFEDVFDYVYELVSRVTWFSDELAPAWNTHIAREDPEGTHIRDFIVWIAGAVVTAFAGSVAYFALTWLNEIFVASTAKRDS